MSAAVLTPHPNVAGEIVSTRVAEPQPVDVLVLLDGITQPHWVYRSLQLLAGCAGVRIVAVAIAEHQVAIAATDPIYPHWLWRLYALADRSLFADGSDLTALADVSSLFSKALFRSLPDEAWLADLHPYEVLLTFSDVLVPQAVAAAARYGVWRHCFDGQPVHDPIHVGAREVLEGRELTTAALRSHPVDGSAPLIMQSRHARTISWSYHRNRDNILGKASELALRSLEHLSRTRTLGSCRPEIDRRKIDAAAAPVTGGPHVGQLARLAQRVIRRGLQSSLYSDYWFVAYGFGASGNPLDLPQPQFVAQPPPEISWADPFAVRHEDRYYIFIEELVHATGKAHIAVSQLAADGSWTAPVKALQRDYHLSYPCVFRWRGSWFMVPETGRNRSIEIYRCRRFPDDWALEQMLFENVTAADPTLAEIDGRWWLFVTTAPEGTEPYDELSLFYADTPLGPWHPHDCNPVKSDARSARPAGSVFKWQDAWYRPAQICTPRYGVGMAMNEIMRLSSREFEERTVRRIVPQWRAGLLGGHTFNRAGDLTVTDGWSRRRRGL